MVNTLNEGPQKNQDLQPEVQKLRPADREAVFRTLADDPTVKPVIEKAFSSYMVSIRPELKGELGKQVEASYYAKKEGERLSATESGHVMFMYLKARSMPRPDANGPLGAKGVDAWQALQDWKIDGEDVRGLLTSGKDKTLSDVKWNMLDTILRDNSLSASERELVQNKARVLIQTKVDLEGLKEKIR